MNFSSSSLTGHKGVVVVCRVICCKKKTKMRMESSFFFHKKRERKKRVFLLDFQSALTLFSFSCLRLKGKDRRAHPVVYQRRWPLPEYFQIVFSYWITCLIYQSANAHTHTGAGTLLSKTYLITTSGSLAETMTLNVFLLCGWTLLNPASLCHVSTTWHRWYPTAKTKALFQLPAYKLESNWK